MDAYETQMFLDSAFEACDDLYGKLDDDDTEEYKSKVLPPFIPVSSRFLPNSDASKNESSNVNDRMEQRGRSGYRPHSTPAPSYYCDGKVILKIEARLSAALAYITNPKNASDFDNLSSGTADVLTETESLKTSLVINRKENSWKPVTSLGLTAGNELVEDLKISHETYKKEKEAEDFTCYTRMSDSDWQRLLRDVENDANRLYSWIIDKLYNEPQSRDAQVYSMKQVANKRPLLLQQYHIVSLFIPLVRSDSTTVAFTALEELNPYLNSFEKEDIKSTLGTFLILKTYINKINRLILLEQYPEDPKQRAVFDRCH